MICPPDILTQIKGKQLVIDQNKELALFLTTVTEWRVLNLVDAHGGLLKRV